MLVFLVLAFLLLQSNSLSPSYMDRCYLEQITFDKMNRQVNQLYTALPEQKAESERAFGEWIRIRTKTDDVYAALVRAGMKNMTGSEWEKANIEERQKLSRMMKDRLGEDQSNTGYLESLAALEKATASMDEAKEVYDQTFFQWETAQLERGQAFTDLQNCMTEEENEN